AKEPTTHRSWRRSADTSSRFPATPTTARSPIAPTSNGRTPCSHDGKRAQMIRVGQGFDVHRHSDDPARPLVLGGCRFDGARGPAGHSDADGPAHAAADALLGAAGLGDLGAHFPDTDARWAGADSLMILSATADMVREAGWTIGNVDVKVVCERPKLAPRKD